MKYPKPCLISITIFAVLCRLQYAFGAKTNYVTCGSVVKLLNSNYGMRLHSHVVKYGSGSGQQSVTGIELKEDVNSHWVIKGPTNELCDIGEPIKCGDTIRLEHLSSKRNLHSHIFSSPLSGEQEVSAYGDGGVGDSGDHWEVICNDNEWLRDAYVRFRHVDTGAYLSMSGRSFGRPISGQMEVVGVSNPTDSTRWKTAEGIFIAPKEKVTQYVHSEL